MKKPIRAITLSLALAANLALANTYKEQLTGQGFEYLGYVTDSRYHLPALPWAGTLVIMNNGQGFNLNLQLAYIRPGTAVYGLDGIKGKICLISPSNAKVCGKATDAQILN